MRTPTREQTCCFSGHRPEKIVPCDMQSMEIPSFLRAPLSEAIRDAYAQGRSVFLSGMSRGFDLWAAQAVLSLADELPLSLLAITPFKGHEQRWEAPWQALHHEICARAEAVYSVMPAYAYDVFYARNRFLIDASSQLICYYNGHPGGTRYTMRYAGAQNVPIINLEDGQLTL